jgi:hypothetical protein
MRIGAVLPCVAWVYLVTRYAEEAAVSEQAGQLPPLDRWAFGTVGQVVRQLGWPGIALAETRLFGCRVVPVVVLDLDAHRIREASGDGPRLDGETLAVWERPGAAGRVPAPLRLSGVLIPARRGWRRALGEARRWRGFGPAAVLVPPAAPIDDVCRWEFAFHGVGLVSGDCVAEDPAGPIVPAEPGRRASARRSTVDRWVEETLYQQALDAGHYSLADRPS